MRYKEGKSRSELELGLLEDLIDEDHYIRLLDEFVDLAVSAQEENYTNKGLGKIGQLPYGSRDLLKIYLYGYYNRITSSRRLEAESGRNIELIWLLNGLQPSYKTIADYRRDHGESIRLLLGQFNSLLKSNQYIEGKKVSIDSVRLKANTSRNGWSIKKIEGRMNQIKKQMNQYMKALDLNDEGELKLENLVRLEAEQQRALEKICRLKEEIDDLEKKRGTR